MIRTKLRAALGCLAFWLAVELLGPIVSRKALLSLDAACDAIADDLEVSR